MNYNNNNDGGEKFFDDNKKNLDEKKLYYTSSDGSKIDNINIKEEEMFDIGEEEYEYDDDEDNFDEEDEDVEEDDDDEFDSDEEEDENDDLKTYYYNYKQFELNKFQQVLVFLGIIGVSYYMRPTWEWVFFGSSFYTGNYSFFDPIKDGDKQFMNVAAHVWYEYSNACFAIGLGGYVMCSAYVYFMTNEV